MLIPFHSIPFQTPPNREALTAHRGRVAYFALDHPQDDVKQLIEHALGRLGYIGLGESEETRANVLVLEPASALHLEAARPLREVWPALPIVCVAVLAPCPEALALRPAAYLVKPFTIAGLRAIVESVLNTDLQSATT
jgi:hypothetical protein